MDYSNVDYNSIFDMLSSFIEYIRYELMNDSFLGLIMHMFSSIPQEIRACMNFGLCLMFALAFIFNIRK